MLNKKIMIIGGTGALGKTLLARYIKDNDIIVLSRDEHKHYNLKKRYPNVNFIVGNVKDKKSIQRVINLHRPEVIINAAALKHVPICEANIYESVRVNIIGHQNLIDCVLEAPYSLESLVFISTDKACNPLNVYGMCKFISERLYVDFSINQSKTKVVITRYGNVLQSTGSVIPFFKSLLREEDCESLPITDYEMTRFLMTLDEAVDLIHWAYSHPDSHGNIVVPKMKSLRITDLAKVLSKYIVGEQVHLKEVGKRPGEKVHESMINKEESTRTLEFEDYFMITNNQKSNTEWTYSSADHILEYGAIESFLKDRGVL